MQQCQGGFEISQKARAPLLSTPLTAWESLCVSLHGAVDTQVRQRACGQRAFAGRMRALAALLLCWRDNAWHNAWRNDRLSRLHRSPRTADDAAGQVEVWRRRLCQELGARPLDGPRGREAQQPAERVVLQHIDALGCVCVCVFKVQTCAYACSLSVVLSSSGSSQRRSGPAARRCPGVCIVCAHP